MRYEDLRADPRAACRKALAFAGMSASSLDLDAALENAWRENLRRREDMYADLRGRIGPSLRDFRSDSVGAYAHVFSPALNEQICERYRGMMERLGYLPPRT